MNLSRLLLNPFHPEARRDLVSPYELHRTLKRAFPAGEPQENRLLFRIEPAEEAWPGTVTVLVQSSQAVPDWRFLQHRPDYALQIDGPRPFSLGFQAGERLRFRLVANPTVRRKRAGKKHGARVPLIHDGPNAADHPTYFDWLSGKSEEMGVQFPTLQLDDGYVRPAVSDAPFRIGSPRADAYSKSRLPLFGVRFDGTLAVTDPDRLKHAVSKGVGPAKGFGFGLLSLSRT